MRRQVVGEDGLARLDAGERRRAAGAAGRQGLHRVGRVPGAREIGWAPVDPTPAGREGPLRPLDGVPVLHGHGDTFAIPPGAVRLAGTALCANQAFAIGRHALGVQSTRRRMGAASRAG
ncbi:hypothetical protein [Methylobacterium sp. ID0610]|uniref:hypothetical protein n=1 Tax=Methylobacterium carpenticola TaxID=3344827 RepID=UPI0036966983